MTKILKVDGMACSHCSASVTNALKALAGVEHVEVNLASKSVTITMIAEISDNILREAIENIGFDVIT